MKKILLTFTVLMGALSSAQISKGTVYLSGQAAYSKSGNENSASQYENFKILPTAGFFVAQNLAVGLGVGYTHQKTFQQEILTIGNIYWNHLRDDKNSAFVASPFVRKYWILSDKLYFFGQLEVPLEFGKRESYESYNPFGSPINGTYIIGNISTYSANYTSIGINVKPGLDYFITKNWTIDATLGEFGYKSYKLDLEESQKVNRVDGGLKLSSVTLGVKYVFSK
ncbi:outer membrane protein [Chryseobacterium sp. GP-SGM7]|uniref:outer membrane protein n=1 Tax=Chryseobacterium sp. GP-SGM7 TaxID=3411323 RepID=UPI003B95C163